MNARREIAKIQRFIGEQVEKSEAKGIVIGLSGGIDSTVAAFLSVRALGEKKVLGVLLPSQTTPDKNREDALEVAKQLRIDYTCIPIADIIQSFGKHLPEFEEGRLPKANLQARVRMCILYYFANLKNYLVCGTTDASENFLGYYTKHGDGAADIEPLITLTKTEVRTMARELGVAESITRKKSSPDLIAGRDAEGDLGVSYELLDRLLIQNKATEHKRKPPISP
jgi:NAD+ synthase